MKYTSWGNYPKLQPLAVWPMYWHGQTLPLHQTEHDILPYAQGNSYGDSCLIDQGILIDTKAMNRFIAFDKQHGILRCEAGITFSDMLHLIVPYGWFLPVVPGTQMVTLGGAIANDIHGKNHHRVGTFGCFVKRFELMRSTTERHVCSQHQNTDLFAATIGGLGLTGLITWAEIQLIPITSAYMDVECIRFKTMDDFFKLNHESEIEFDYTVAWLDCLSRETTLGRGIYMRANHSKHTLSPTPVKKPISIPCFFPNFTLNHVSIKTLNAWYYHKKIQPRATVHYQSYFFPLDTINHWNKIYGKRGFFQYQCVLPTPNQFAMTLLLEKIAQSGQGSFLSVLKTFGEIKSPGLLSFPKKGITLALDFANQGLKTLELLNELDHCVLTHGGRVYPAKDARMSSHAFKIFFPHWVDFMHYKDRKFNSNFLHRVLGQHHEH